MISRTPRRTLRPLCAALLTLAGLALAACNGTISSIGVPADSPWTVFSTLFQSPHDDLTVVSTGSNVTAELLNAGAGAVCDSDQGHFPASCATSTCGVADCEAAAPEGATNVSFVDQRFIYGLVMTLDRPAFTAGGVEVASATAGTQGAISLTVSPGSGLSIGAGFTDGLVPMSGDQLLTFDDAGTLLLRPQWEDFGPGWVCTDGTSTCDPESDPDEVVALCGNEPPNDQVSFRVDAPPGTYSFTCGSVPVTLSLDAAEFASAGACISSLTAQNCSGLRGQARASCVIAQIGICRAKFNHGPPPAD